MKNVARVTILGAGISGLATAWFLKQKHGMAIDITLVEKSSRIGGWIQSEYKEGFLFEKGPRSCRTKGTGRATLELIESLGLQSEVISAHSAANRRYLYYQQLLQPFPTSLSGLPFSPLLKGWLKAAWQEWKTPPNRSEDPTIEEFFTRRIGADWTHRLIDPMVSGIYAGDIRKLSLKSCFPLFFQWEQQYGSLLKGAFKQPKKIPSPSPFVSSMEKTSLFSFKKGMETLPLALAQRLDADFRFNAEVKEIQRNKVKLNNGQELLSDMIISTLPFKELSYASVVVVNLAYRQPVLNHTGFGYLIPSQEKEAILGVVFDSAVFPEQGNPEDTRLTVMLGGTRHPEVIHWSKEHCLSIAKEALKKHLGIHAVPHIYSVSYAREAIPQFEVGHHRWMDKIHEKGVYQSGCGISGVSVNDCIAYAKNLADKVVVC